MLTLKPVRLQGALTVLEPLEESHRDALYAAAQDETIWTHNATNALGDRFHRWFDKALTSFKNQQHLPFVIRRHSDKKIIGSTRFYDITPEHHRLTIGYTWYLPEMWGSFANPECKLLLLQHAFEDLKVNRVEFVTDARNSRSRAAIKKLGATEEGTLRQHMILENGWIRDTVIFSIIPAEWPDIKSKLLARIESFKQENTRE
jgi:RimJ/RimL family protein N-acetyltransferase